MRLRVVILVLALPLAARADDEREDAPELAAMQGEVAPPKLPPPFVVPELTHPVFDARADWIVGGGPGASMGLLRPGAEARVGVLRRFYAGAEWPLAAAATDGTQARVVSGNASAHVRFVFALPSSLAVSAGIGVALPTARFAHASPAHAAAVAAASLEPTELVALTPDAIGLRPVLDFRFVRGPLVVQLRDGLDFAFDTATDYRVRATGRLLGHLGVLTSPDVELSVEGTQQYFFGAGDYYGPELADGRRTAVTLGPGARVSFRDVDVGVGAATNVVAPLSDRFGRFVAVRLSLVTHPFAGGR
jgi:hypothetical protein